MRILIMGPPGVGKGTQAKHIKTELKILHLSTGEILRKEIYQKTEIGNEAKIYIDKGCLVPDEILLNIMKDRLSRPECSQGYILDGFPRTITQASGLDDIMDSLDETLDVAISLIADKDELVKRLINRGEESGRSDDAEAIIRNRQQIYWRETAPLLDYYQTKGLLKNVDGLGSVLEITNRILNVLK